MIKKYNKLVRDRIPEIIQAAGKTAGYEILSDEAFLQKLEEKLEEEVAEFRAEKDLEELADLLEVIYAIARARNCSPEELESIRREKEKARGGFRQKILLIEVGDEQGSP